MAVSTGIISIGRQLRFQVAVMLFDEEDLPAVYGAIGKMQILERE
jgi:hypothetical protein